MTSIDLSLAYLPPGNTQYSGGQLQPAGGLAGGFGMDFILPAPQMLAGQTYTLHVNGHFDAGSIDCYSILTPDASGYSSSFYYNLHTIPHADGFMSATVDLTIGTGVEDFDSAITAGEVYIYMYVGGLSGDAPYVDSIAFDGVSGGGGTDEPPYTADVPAFITGSDDGVFAAYGANPISDPGTSSDIPVTESALGLDPGYVYVKYGVGPNRFNWTLPDGMMVTSMQYVLKAYREDDVVFDSPAPTGWTPSPASNPWLSLEAADRPERLAVSSLPVTTSWSDAPDEILVDELEWVAILNHDVPMDRLTAMEWSTSLSAVIRCAYLAIRVTYEPIGISGTPDPVRRRFY